VQAEVCAELEAVEGGARAGSSALSRRAPRAARLCSAGRLPPLRPCAARPAKATSPSPMHKSGESVEEDGSAEVVA